jgi:hypothetical protein
MRSSGSCEVVTPRAGSTAPRSFSTPHDRMIGSERVVEIPAKNRELEFRNSFFDRSQLCQSPLLGLEVGLKTRRVLSRCFRGPVTKRSPKCRRPIEASGCPSSTARTPSPSTVADHVARMRLAGPVCRRDPRDAAVAEDPWKRATKMRPSKRRVHHCFSVHLS